MIGNDNKTRIKTEIAQLRKLLKVAEHELIKAVDSLACCICDDSVEEKERKYRNMKRKLAEKENSLKLMYSTDIEPVDMIQYKRKVTVNQSFLGGY